MSKKYTKKQINSAIMFLKTQKPPIAEIQYIDESWCESNGINVPDGDLLLYDYMSNSHLTENQVIACAKEMGWEC